MMDDLEHETMGPPRSQDEAFRAGLRGAPFCDVDNYEVAMITKGTTPFIPSRPTLFIVVDLIGPHQEKYLPITYWAYDKELELQECYRIGRVLRFILWLLDVADLDERRAQTFGAGLMQAGKLQVEKHLAGRVADRYDARKFITHFQRLMEHTSAFKSLNRAPTTIENDLTEYAYRRVKATATGLFGFSVDSGVVPAHRWTSRSHPRDEGGV